MKIISLQGSVSCTIFRILGSRWRSQFKGQIRILMKRHTHM